MGNFARVLRLFAFAAIAAAAFAGVGVWPPPREVHELQERFELDGTVPILLPVAASTADAALAHRLAGELADRHGFAARVVPAHALPSNGKYIVIGTRNNVFVREICRRHNWSAPGPEGYILRADARAVVVAGSDPAGAFYGYQSLRQLIGRSTAGLSIAGVEIRDWPFKPFRGIKLYVPGRDSVPFFKRFVRDFMALYKYNKLIIEMNGAMRLDRHPEVNAGWIDMGRELIYSRRDVPFGPRMQIQNSSHHDAADGGVLEKREIADLVRWAAQEGIEVIPELPSLSHCYYLLARHHELAEYPEQEWPDTYCPSLDASYRLLFDVYDEYIEVMRPKMVHIGHDEWRIPIGICARCRGRNYGDLYGRDVRRIYDYLKARGISVAMWADHLMPAVRDAPWDTRTTKAGWTYTIPGALTAAQVERWIPKDILMFNWAWDERYEPKRIGEMNDRILTQYGFQQIYGNFVPGISRYEERSRRTAGGAPSAWVATTEFNFGKDLVYDFTGCANLLWSSKWLPELDLVQTVQQMMPTIRANVSGRTLPSENGDAVVPLATGARDGVPALAGLKPLRSGLVRPGNLVFDLPPSGNLALVSGSPNAIPIGEDVSSIVFLHAAAKRAAKQAGHYYIYNFPDTADLLGWYEVVYEDGLVETIPLRYGWNILEWDWGGQRKTTAYQLKPVSCGNSEPVHFFAFEWENPRLGKKIREVRLSASHGFTDTRGNVIRENAVMVAAVSVVKPRSVVNRQRE